MDAIEPALPILQKIHDGTLCLSEINMGPGMASGIGVACSMSEELFNSIFFDNNGLVDEDLAKILDGTLELYVLRQLVVRRNEFGLESVKRIGSIL